MMSHRTWRVFWGLCCIVFFASLGNLSAQDSSTFLALISDVKELQTGQSYTVNMQLIDAPDVWVLSAKVEYDPKFIYVIGTSSGSPVSPGNLFAPIDSTVTIRNLVTNNRQLEYTISMVAPASAPSGSGVVGSFQIYPLSKGTSQLRFKEAKLTSISHDQNGNVVPQAVPFTASALDISISGDDVSIPVEATATPTESPTFEAVHPDNATEVPTLVNVTLDPNLLTPSAEIPQEAVSDSTGNLLPLALGLVSVAVLGLLLLGYFWKRQRP